MPDPKEIPVPRFKYVGPHDAVDLDGVGTVRHGVAFTAPAPVAASLKGRDDFKSVTTNAKPKES